MTGHHRFRYATLVLVFLAIVSGVWGSLGHRGHGTWGDSSDPASTDVQECGAADREREVVVFLTPRGRKAGTTKDTKDAKSTS